MRKKFLAVLAALPLMWTAVPAQASDADYHNPQVAWVHDVKATNDSATLIAKYRCYGGNDGTHLWVSLKQGGGITGSPTDLAAMQGTSMLARSWYDSHPEGVVCDGHWQIQMFTVFREMGFPDSPHPQPWEPLMVGDAFLQFCLFDNTADPEGVDLSHGFGYLYKYVHVSRV
ncbi:MAG: hypothetical protein QOG52_1287 [Frankiaceae bacterium]|nr:hypothetical protein [Frankiaceae bacterium]